MLGRVASGNFEWLAGVYEKWSQRMEEQGPNVLIHYEALFGSIELCRVVCGLGEVCLRTR